ncbi:flagellar basal-body MS-ring/collar protein FliF [Enterococcus sp. LJL98]
MVAKLKDGLEQLKEKWQETSPLVKKAIVLFAVSAVVVGSFVFYFVTKVDYGILFSDMSSADAGMISQDLKEKKIPYQLKDNGKTILIPVTEIDEYRIDLAVDNKLPDSTTGFELFDTAGIMTTDEDRKIMYQRALTGELQRAIHSLDGVEKVKVILVTPEDDLFSTNQKEATASIVLTLKKALEPASIQGIVALTTGAVENLKAENVKVVDSNGQILSVVEEEDDFFQGGANNKYMEMKRSYEESLEKKVERLLEPIYGADRAKVSINVDLDFDSVESTRTTYGNPEVRSENVQATGTGEDIERAQTGQVNDNVTNVTGGTNEGNSSYSRSINNELDTEVVTTINAPGTIRRMTSSIVVSANVPADVRRELEALVASAVGFDETRGDNIAVQGIDFNQGEEVIEEETQGGAIAIKDNFNQYLLYFVIFSGVISTLLIVILTIVLLKRKRQEENYLVADEEVEEMTEEARVTAAPIFETFDVADETPQRDEREENENPIEKKRQLQKEQVREQQRKDKAAKDYAVENPEVAAELIKSWLKELK